MAKDFNIEDILDKLVGHTDVACESNYDEKSLENMKMLDRVMSWGIEILRQNADWHGDERGSAEKISEYALELIRTYVDELLNCLPEANISDSDCESEVEK